MYKLLLLFASIIISQLLNAQKFDMDADTALINGSKIFYIKTVKKATILNANWELSIRTMQGKEVMYLKEAQLMFMDDGAKVTYEGKEKPKNIAQHIVDNELIEVAGINAEAKKRYLIKNASTNIENTPTDNEGLVVRNKSSFITVIGDKIKQEGKIIGFYKEGIDNSNNWYLEIKGIKGNTIARATFKDVTDTNIYLITAKDNKTRLVKCEFSANRGAEVAKWLTDNLYL